MQLISKCIGTEIRIWTRLYGAVNLDNSPVSLVNQLESVQIEAMRIVTGGTKLAFINKLNEETDSEKLSDRREKHRLILLYKIINNETSEYLQSLIQNSVDSFHGHYTRQSQNIKKFAL